MSPRRLLPLPAKASRARAPMWACLALAAMVVAQLALPPTVAVPPGGAVAQLAPAKTWPQPRAVTMPPALAARPLFTPVTLTGAAAASDPMAGAVIAGTVRQGGRLFALVSAPGQPIRVVGPGARIGALRIVALTPAGARLADDGGHVTLLAYGAHPAPATASGNDQ